MDNKDIQQYLIKSSLIESRLIILKRRAAEADFLREERDMLISRLKLYNPDYVWPDSGINKCLKLPIDKEFEQVQKRNENLISENGELIEARKQLRSQNDDLKAHIQSLEKELGNMKKDYSNFEVLSKENEQLKTLLQEMASLKDEKEQLLIEKEQLKEDLNKLLDAGTNESDQNSRMLLKQLYIRINNCSEQYNNLLKELWSKEVQIDVLTGKITQLNAQLNEPYISAKIKLSRGKNLSDEEAYMWAVSNLEMTNKKMNCELQKVTDQLNLVTEKYMKIKDELGPMKRSQKPNGPVPPYELENALRKLQEDEYIWELKNEGNSASDIYEWSDKGSTAPVTRDASEESMFHPLTLINSINKVEILHEHAMYLEEYHEKLMNIKMQLRVNIMQQRVRFHSRIQDVNIRRSTVMKD